MSAGPGPHHRSNIPPIHVFIPILRQAGYDWAGALRASEAAAVRIEDYSETLRGHRVLHLVGKGNKPATMPLTVPVLRVLETCRGERTEGPLVLGSVRFSV